MRQLLIILVLVLITTPGTAQISWWAVDESQRVYEDLRTNPAYLNDSNKVCHLTGGVPDSIHLFAARNETVTPQLVLRCGSTKVSNVNVWLPYLTDGTHTIINTSNACTTLAGRYNEPFLLNNVDVPDREGSATWANAYPMPNADYTGRSGEQCVPLEAPVKIIVGAGGDTTQGGGGNTTGPTSGAGFVCLNDRNTVIPFDIYIPKATPSGTYYGSTRVWQTTGSTLFEIPVKLRVYNFTLPDTNHLMVATHFEQSAMCAYAGISTFSTAMWEKWQPRVMNMFHRHRIDANSSQDKFDSLKLHEMGYWNGNRFTAGHGYSGPGAGVGMQIYIPAEYNRNFDNVVSNPPLQPGQAGNYTHSPDGWRRLANDFGGAFYDSCGTRVKVLLQPLDEPNGGGGHPEQWRMVDTVADWIRTDAGYGCQNIHIWADGRGIEMTSANHSPASGFSSSVSAWCPDGEADNKWAGFWTTRGGGNASPYYSVEAMRARLANDHVKGLVGTYNCRPGYAPTLEWRDHVLAEARLYPWVLYSYADFYWLWTTTYYSTVEPLGTMNPWQTLNWGVGASGGGCYLYFGKDAINTAEDRGIEMPIFSIRLKAFRRGLQDIEYLWLAVQAGKLDPANMTWYHEAGMWAAFNDPSYPSKHTKGQTPNWSYLRGFTMEAVRQKMADALGVVEGGTTPPPPPPAGLRQLRAHRTTP